MSKKMTKPEALESLARLDQEHPMTKKARLAINKLQTIQQKRRDLDAEMLAAKIEVAKALVAMEAAGEHSPWAEHWRINLNEIA